MTLRLGELWDLGEPEVLEYYTRSLPVHRTDVCNMRDMFGEKICSRWAGHGGQHAEIGTTNLVLAVWDRRDGRDPFDEDSGPDIPDAVVELWEELNEIAESVTDVLSSADTELHSLRARARGIPHTEALVDRINDAINALVSMDNYSGDLGADESDWE